jgi:hypothetical protein
VRITDENREEGLVISFEEFDDAELRPLFLGHSTSRAQIDYWTEAMPVPPQSKTKMSERSLAAFREKIELAQEIARNKNKAKKVKSQQESIIKRGDMARML